ncbi:MAG: DUF1080 domain-containing protein [Phycisphaerales bacterium]|jgi:hypothetical protein|nr:DUF1080 domain-containing protein [Phycisphaerales bacterium]
MILLSLTVLLSCTTPQWEPLFNGKNLDGWTIVNGAQSTWTVQNKTIVCSGKPTGVMRTNTMYENFVLELEWRHNVPNGNAGLFVWSDPIPAVGVPFTRAIEVQIMDGNELDWYTTHGDIFSIWGATMTPDDPHPHGEHVQRCLPSERRSKPAPEWNHYTVTCIDGQINLSVNGAFVSGASDVTPNKGYICLESEGTEVVFRNIRILELPPSAPPTTDVANLDVGFVTLYTGIDLTGWEGDPTHWKPQGWSLHHDGEGAPMTTTQPYEMFEIMVDVKCKDPSCQPFFIIDDTKVHIPTSEKGWSRFVVQGKGATISLGSTKEADFCNIFIRPVQNIDGRTLKEYEQKVIVPYGSTHGSNPHNRSISTCSLSSR